MLTQDPSALTQDPSALTQDPSAVAGMRGFGMTPFASGPTFPCDTNPMQSPLQAPTAATDPASVKVHLTTGAGMDIAWKDGHTSHYSFVYLRDACPCAMCEDDREKSGRHAGDPVPAAPATLPIFKPAARPLSAEGVGKYAIKFSWNDSHDLGIYSWALLREICPCAECKAARAAE